MNLLHLLYNQRSDIRIDFESQIGASATLSSKGLRLPANAEECEPLAQILDHPNNAERQARSNPYPQCDRFAPSQTRNIGPPLELRLDLGLPIGAIREIRG